MGLLVNIDVPDLAAAERFYVEAFDLTPGRRFGGAAVELVGWPSPVYLLQKSPGSEGAPGSRRDYARHWTPVHMDVTVPDIDAAVARALAAGANLEAPAEAHAWGRIAMLADPFGHGFCLIEFTGRGYDAIAT